MGHSVAVFQAIRARIRLFEISKITYKHGAEIHQITYSKIRKENGEKNALSLPWPSIFSGIGRQKKLLSIKTFKTQTLEC